MKNIKKKYSIIDSSSKEIPEEVKSSLSGQLTWMKQKREEKHRILFTNLDEVENEKAFRYMRPKSKSSKINLSSSINLKKCNLRPLNSTPATKLRSPTPSIINRPQVTNSNVMSPASSFRSSTGFKSKNDLLASNSNVKEKSNFKKRIKTLENLKIKQSGNDYRKQIEFDKDSLSDDSEGEHLDTVDYFHLATESEKQRAQENAEVSGPKKEENDMRSNRFRPSFHTVAGRRFSKLSNEAEFAISSNTNLQSPNISPNNTQKLKHLINGNSKMNKSYKSPKRKDVSFAKVNRQLDKVDSIPGIQTYKTHENNKEQMRNVQSKIKSISAPVHRLKINEFELKSLIHRDFNVDKNQMTESLLKNNKNFNAFFENMQQEQQKENPEYDQRQFDQKSALLNQIKQQHGHNVKLFVKQKIIKKKFGDVEKVDNNDYLYTQSRNQGYNEYENLYENLF